MILKRLINPKPIIVIFFILFGVIFFSIPLLKHSIKIFNYSTVPYYVVFGSGLFITLIHALGLNNLITQQNIIKKDNLILAFVYVFLSTPFYNSIKGLIISFMLLFCVNYLFKSYKKENPFSEIFNSSLIFSILFFFDSNIIFLSLLIILFGFNYGNGNIRTLFTSIIAFTIVCVFYFMYCTFTSHSFYFPEFPNINVINLKTIYQISKTTLAWVILVILISCFSFIELYSWLYKKSIKSRKSFIIILLYFLITIILTLFININNYYYLTTPLSIVMANYFIYTKNRFFAELLFLLLITCSIMYKYISLI